MQNNIYQKKPNFDWTDNHIDQLKQLWASGETATAIAEVFGEGITRNAVIGKAHRLKLGSRKIVSTQSRDKEPVERVQKKKGRRPPPVATRPVKSTPPPLGGRPFVNSDDKHCRFPLWGMELIPIPEKMCCGAEVEDGSSYCAAHKRRMSLGRLR